MFRPSVAITTGTMPSHAPVVPSLAPIILDRSAALAVHVAVDATGVFVKLVRVDLGKLRGSGDNAVTDGRAAGGDAHRVTPAREREPAVDGIEKILPQRVGLLEEA